MVFSHCISFEVRQAPKNIYLIVLGGIKLITKGKIRAERWTEHGRDFGNSKPHAIPPNAVDTHSTLQPSKSMLASILVDVGSQ
jgi:hypothetical protein